MTIWRCRKCRGLFEHMRTVKQIVNKIEVYERELKNGERVQKIDIYYNFVGILDQAKESRTVTYHWVEGMV